jgi:hypothetical protein
VVRIRAKAVLGIVVASVAVIAAVSLAAAVEHASAAGFRRAATAASEGSQAEARPTDSPLWLNDGEGGETQRVIAARHRHARRRREEYSFSTYHRGDLDLSADLVPDTGLCFLDVHVTVSAFANAASRLFPIDSRVLLQSDLIELSTVCLRC